jgi:hypothetical protein
MGLKVYFEKGMNSSTSGVQEIDENTGISENWNISGYFRLVSRANTGSAADFGSGDISSFQCWNGFNASFPPVSSDFEKISLVLRKKWKSSTGQKFVEEIFNIPLGMPSGPGMVYSNEDTGLFIREIGPDELDGTSESRDYFFSLKPEKMDIHFAMPLECANTDIFLYLLELAVKGEKAQWNSQGASFSVSDYEYSAVQKKILVRDRGVPEIIISSPLPEKCTTGDPLYPAMAGIKILDTNPNQEIDEIYIEFSNNPLQKYYFKTADIAAKRDYSGNVSLVSPYISSLITRNFSFDDPENTVLMPANGFPLDYTIVVKPSFGPASSITQSITNIDNDPPDIRFSIGTDSSDPAGTGISVRVYNGVYDPYDKSTRADAEFQTRGQTPVKAVITEEKSGPWSCNLDPVFAGVGIKPSIPEDQRLYYFAQGTDNVDGRVDAVLSGALKTSGSQGVVNFRASGRKTVVISASDKAGNTRTVSFSLNVQKGSFSASTIGSN